MDGQTDARGKTICLPTLKEGDIINIEKFKDVYFSYKKKKVSRTLSVQNEPGREKTNKFGSDQVRHKQGCTVTEDC